MQAKKAKQLLKARLCFGKRCSEVGEFDMWSERDGPQLFETPDGIPSARFFPKGVVHSIKPYEKIYGLGDSDEEELNSGLENENQERIKDGFERKVQYGELTEGNRMNRRRDGKFRKMNRSRHMYGSSELDSGQVGFNRKQREVNSQSSVKFFVLNF
ncbi:hypothetical protein K2173_012292 [Erythroxylum novogranatense]|uniref:Uncharacterized protein n=1 Tax=Erythroxylum novogranatense TaxID=1862640 RepID=A0AAV8SBZ0_9ROSI|nr:hypothetical protein K2173_012292 [Erythroxylum novogranatense]